MEKEAFEIKKLTKKIRKSVWKAHEDFQMIEKGDKVMVCLSGGKDSYTMLDALMHMQLVRKDFEIVAVNLDQKQPGFPEEVLPNYLEGLGVDFKIIERDTYSIVKEKVPEGKTTCSLCSRLRRGTLYTAAEELGCTKIALGHHREDILETFFLNLFFSGKLESMPPKYKTDDGKHVVIRPLAYCKEADIIEYSNHMQFPIIPCNLCGSQPNLQRQVVKQMLKKWEETYNDRNEIMMNALSNISPSHLLDHDLYDFVNYEMKKKELHVDDKQQIEL
ncbi:tRNA 2-thiocytidine biosynthesis protein TtcA [Aureibacter tunicatorum]|uniref:tRNA-cytidine(32) 2-sulfurtransferase n=2 Tax=Aureibacter tunicatorum TaxID=866807 RepID=A0AAE4BSQ7_9BACT|nr:tRNA 2-thiocytidine biosynthesis protein TtcA [Aureibacter tunicatorum]BDD05392.1 tRNA 2-thiocytidine biosynthesis protein TtcA [Aureibacter tunicatorum]